MANVTVGSILSANLAVWVGEPQEAFRGTYNASNILNGWRYQLDSSVVGSASDVINSIFWIEDWLGFGSQYYMPVIFDYNATTKIVTLGDRGGTALGGSSTTINIGTLPALTSNKSNLYYTWDPSARTTGWYIYYEGLSAPVAISSYNSATKEYVMSGTFSPAPVAGTKYILTLGAALNSISSPSPGKVIVINKQIRLQRNFQWFRDGVPIANAVRTMYTAQPSDIGKNITVSETSGRITYNNYASSWEVPTETTTTFSSPVTVTGTANSSLIYQDDIVYEGSFRLPDALPISGSYGGFASIIPAAYSQNGQESLLIYGGSDGLPAIEYSIVSPAKSTSFFSLPSATKNRTLSDPFGGNLVAGANGMDINYGPLGAGYFDNGSGKSFLTCTSAYTFQELAYVYVRQTSTASTGTVEGPITIIDPVKNTNARVNCGAYCSIPSSWQSTLGGDTLISSRGTSTIGNNSDGPGFCSFYKADVDTAISKIELGTARGGSNNTIQLSASAVGSTTDYYKNWWIYAQSSSDNAKRIISYDSSTKTATVDSAWTSNPTASTTYKIFPYVSGNQLSKYAINALEPDSLVNGHYCRIWSGGSGAQSPFWINGTDSILIIGGGGGEIYQYGERGSPEPVTWDSGLKGPNIIYSIAGVGKGAYFGWSANQSAKQVFAYNANELAQVKAGTLTFANLKPYAEWSLQFPLFSGETPGFDLYKSAGVVWSGASKRLYIVASTSGLSGVGNTAVVHVYSCTKAI